VPGDRLIPAALITATDGWLAGPGPKLPGGMRIIARVEA
jgi:hypothetical protein